MKKLKILFKNKEKKQKRLRERIEIKSKPKSSQEGAITDACGTPEREPKGKRRNSLRHTHEDRSPS